MVSSYIKECIINRQVSNNCFCNTATQKISTNHIKWLPYLLRVDTMLTAKSMSAANIGVSVGAVTFASELAMLPASLIASVSFN